MKTSGLLASLTLLVLSAITAADDKPGSTSVDRFVLAKVRLLPKPGTTGLLAGARITGSNEGPTTAFVELATIKQAPVVDGWLDVAVPPGKVYRYVKFESAKENGVALVEIEFHSPQGPLSGEPFGTSVPKESANTFEKASDNDPQTFFVSTTDHSYVGLDLGSVAQAPLPQFKPAGGASAEPQEVTIGTWPGGTTIRYTTDGSVPSQSNGQVYQGPIEVSGTMSIAAYASKDGLADSDLAIVTYRIGAAATSARQIRSYHIGNSLTDTVNGFLETVAQSAGHDLYYMRKTIPGCGIEGNFKLCGKGFASPAAWAADYNVVFEKKIDHLWRQPFPNPPGLESDGQYGGQFIELARKRNPQAEIWLYAQWPSWDTWAHDAHCTGAGWMKPVWFPPNRKPANWEEAMANKMLYYLDLKKNWDQQVQGRGEKSVRLCPGGPALVRLKHEIEAGRVPGIADFHDAIFADGIHLTRQGRYLVALVHYGCLFGESPEGKVTFANSGLNREQATFFQRLAWEAVLAEPLTGVRSATDAR